MHFNLRFNVVSDVQEHWSGVPGNGKNGGARSNGGGWFGGRSAAEEHRIEPRSPLPTQPHDIAFCACEGDFQVRGRSGVFPADQIPLPCLKQYFHSGELKSLLLQPLCHAPSGVCSLLLKSLSHAQNGSCRKESWILARAKRMCKEDVVGRGG